MSRYFFSFMQAYETGNLFLSRAKNTAITNTNEASLSSQRSYNSLILSKPLGLVDVKALMLEKTRQNIVALHLCGR